METVTKALALVTGGEATDDHPNGAFDLILSAPTLDRDGEIIDARAMEPLPDHIPFDIDHGMSVTTTVGSGTPFYADDGTLRVTGGFASTPLAQEVRSLVTEGHIRTSSVTFMAAEREPDEHGITHIRRAELLNGTFTPVPSNRQAVVLSAKSVEALGAKVGARNSTGDADRLQQIHDMSVENGAMCAKTVDEADGKTAEEEPSGEPAEQPADEPTEETRSVISTADDASTTATAAVETSDAADEGYKARLALAAQALEL